MRIRVLLLFAAFAFPYWPYSINAQVSKSARSKPVNGRPASNQEKKFSGTPLDLILISAEHAEPWLLPLLAETLIESGHTDQAMKIMSPAFTQGIRVPSNRKTDWIGGLALTLARNKQGGEAIKVAGLYRRSPVKQIRTLLEVAVHLGTAGENEASVKATQIALNLSAKLEENKRIQTRINCAFLFSKLGRNDLAVESAKLVDQAIRKTVKEEPKKEPPRPVRSPPPAPKGGFIPQPTPDGPPTPGLFVEHLTDLVHFYVSVGQVDDAFKLAAEVASFQTLDTLQLVAKSLVANGEADKAVPIVDELFEFLSRPKIGDKWEPESLKDHLVTSIAELYASTGNEQKVLRCVSLLKDKSMKYQLLLSAAAAQIRTNKKQQGSKLLDKIYADLSKTKVDMTKVETIGKYADLFAEVANLYLVLGKMEKASVIVLQHTKLMKAFEARFGFGGEGEDFEVTSLDLQLQAAAAKIEFGRNAEGLALLENVYRMLLDKKRQVTQIGRYDDDFLNVANTFAFVGKFEQANRAANEIVREEVRSRLNLESLAQIRQDFQPRSSEISLARQKKHISSPEFNKQAPEIKVKDLTVFAQLQRKEGGKQGALESLNKAVELTKQFDLSGLSALERRLLLELSDEHHDWGDKNQSIELLSRAFRFHSNNVNWVRIVIHLTTIRNPTKHKAHHVALEKWLQLDTYHLPDQNPSDSPYGRPVTAGAAPSIVSLVEPVDRPRRDLKKSFTDEELALAEQLVQLYINAAQANRGPNRNQRPNSKGRPGPSKRNMGKTTKKATPGSPSSLYGTWYKKNGVPGYIRNGSTIMTANKRFRVLKTEKHKEGYRVITVYQQRYYPFFFRNVKADSFEFYRVTLKPDPKTGDPPGFASKELAETAESGVFSTLYRRKPAASRSSRKNKN